MALLTADAGRIDLLFTDVWMRGVMDGVDLSHEVSRRWPWVGILVTSAHVFLTGDRLPPGSRFIRKPYNISHVVHHLRKLAEAA